MPNYRIGEVAELLGVSDDTVRRWVSTGRLSAALDDAHRQVIDGEQLAAFAREQVHVEHGAGSARNRLTGIVTGVQVDGVMAQVEIAAGRFRVVSLMSREAVEDLSLRPGVVATAVIKATTVIVETATAAAR
jgi:molybdopterin-binding protein